MALHSLWILCRVVAGLWLGAVFYTYAFHAYRLAKTDPLLTALSAFATSCVAFFVAAGWV
jgi:hypothetical protein